MMGEPQREGQPNAEPHRARALTEWRIALIRVLFPAIGLALLFAWGAFLASGSGWARWELGALGLFLLGASRHARRAPQAISVAFASAGFGVLAQGVHLGGWSPGVVAGLVCLLVSVGLLLGRGAPYVVIAGLVALFFVGAASVRGAPPGPDFPPLLVLTRLQNWARVGFIVVCFTAATGWALGRIGEMLASTEAQLAGTVSVLREQLALVQATRARRTETEGALRNAQRLQTVAQLGQGFAHVFNNVLTALRSALEEIRAAGSRSELARSLRAIQEVVEHAAARSQDLLALARPHDDLTGETDLELSLTSLARRLRSHLRDNIVLDVESGASAVVGVSERWIEQVMMNLVLNAQQAMPRGGRIMAGTGLMSLEAPRRGRYGTLPAGDYIVIRVRDDGPGMSEEVAEHAFDPFFTTRGRGHHDGLGLTVVFDMARKAGGTVQIERPPRGAAIAVYLPLVRGPARLASRGFEPGGDSRVTRASRGVPAWKAEALHSLIRLSTIGTLVTVSATEIERRLTDGPSLLHLKVGIPLVVLYAVLGWRPGGSYRARLVIFLGSSFTGCLLIVSLAGFMSPSPLASVSLAILLAWILGTPVAAKLALAGTYLVFLAAGSLHASGVLVGAVRQTSLAHSANWFRTAVTLSSISAVGAAFVLHILRAARRRVETLASTEAELETAREQQQAEEDAVIDLQAMAERAARIEAAGRLTGMTAHDLNNSLQVVRGWADVLVETHAEPGGTDVETALEEMKRAADYAEALVSRLGFGEMAPRAVASVDLGEEAARAEGMLSALLRTDQKLVIQSSSGNYVAVDDASFRRVLLNLVANSRDAMVSGGTCRVTIASVNDAVEITVADDGCGMDEATRARLFEAFFTTKGARGTGLGLHSVAATVRAVGGTMAVWSRPRQGTRMTVRLPRARAPQPVKPQSERPAAINGSRARVLLAEDDRQVRQLLKRSLERAGFEVVEAEDGNEAAAFIEQPPGFDALCTDAIMPGRSTPAVIQSFCERFPGRPVLLMSGYLPDEMGDAITNRAEVTFLHKPFAGSRLADALARRLPGGG